MASPQVCTAKCHQRSIADEHPKLQKYSSAGNAEGTTTTPTNSSPITTTKKHATSLKSKLNVSSSLNDSMISPSMCDYGLSRASVSESMRRLSTGMTRPVAASSQAADSTSIAATKNSLGT